MSNIKPNQQFQVELFNILWIYDTSWSSHLPKGQTLDVYWLFYSL